MKYREKTMKAWPTLLLLIWLISGGSLASTGFAQPAPKLQPLSAEEVAAEAGASLIGKFAPPIALNTIDGGKIDLAKLYGHKPVYLKFWATWCVPCRLQMPHFENTERNLGKDIAVVAIDVGFNETAKVVLDYRKKMGLTMPIVIDDGRLADALNLRVTPQHVVIGRDGKILHVGHLADAKLDNALKGAIAEKPADYIPRDLTAKTVGQSAPMLKTSGGQLLALKDGVTPTVVFFFSTWCETYLKSSRPAMAAACTKAREDVTRLSAKSSARWIGVGAGLWASNKDLISYQSDHNLTLPMAIDETGAFFRAYKIVDVPRFLVFDSKGRIIARTRHADEADRIARSAQPSKP